MTTYIYEPYDTIIARDGRPFTIDPGARAETLPFPTPSMTAGLLRSQALLNWVGAPDSNGRYDEEHIKAVLELTVHGPLLAQLEMHEKNIQNWFVSAPKDALLLKQSQNGTGKYLRRLRPAALPKGAVTDLTDSIAPDLQMLQMDTWEESKADAMPEFWRWDLFELWLAEYPLQFYSKKDPQDNILHVAEIQSAGKISQMMFENHTIKSLLKSTRTHLKVQNDTRTSQDGMLFETNGLEFTYKSSFTHEVIRLGLACDASVSLSNTAASAGSIEKYSVAFGGERRFGMLQNSTHTLPPCPKAITEEIARTGRCRVFLLTPAYFSEGYQPTWLLQDPFSTGVQAVLKAAAIDRPLTLSGWDMHKKWPKPTVRMAPAGTVFFLELQGSAEQRKKWIEHVWMSNISDDITNASVYWNTISQSPEQFRRDGFGLAALGTWTEKEAKA